MKHHPSILLSLPSCALVLVASCSNSRSVYSDGSYGEEHWSAEKAQADRQQGRVPDPRPPVLVESRSGESKVVQGYGFFVRGIQDVAYATMLTAAIVLYPFRPH